MKLTEQQRAALQELVGRGVLGQDQADAVRAALDSGPTRSRRGVLWEVLGYLGGVLVLSGALLLAGQTWAELPEPARVLILTAVAVLPAGVGVFIAGGPGRVRSSRGHRARVITVLFALTAVAGAAAVGTAVPEPVGEWPWAVTGLVLAVVGYLALPAAFTAFASCAFTAALVLAAASDWFSWSVPVTTGLLLGAGLLWTVLVLTGVVAQRTALACGLAIALTGAQWPASESWPWAYGSTFVLALLLLAVFLRSRDPVLLAAGVIGVVIAVPEAVWDWTGGALSAPLIVLLAGVVLLVAGGVGLGWRRRTAR